MKSKPGPFVSVCGFVAAVALLLAYYVAGTRGLAGMAMGLFGTGLSVVGWWLVISLISRLSEVGAKPSKGTYWVALAFLLKLPIFVALSNIAHRIGGPAPSCFLAGLGLVYFALVGWVLTRRADLP